MYSEKIYLTPKEILEKEFKIDARGYRAQEVDKFLDMIIRDYTEYISIIKRLDKEIKDLTEDNIKLKNELRKTGDLLLTKEDNTNVNMTNVDILKRISQLEKVVFGSDND